MLKLICILFDSVTTDIDPNYLTLLLLPSQNAFFLGNKNLSVTAVYRNDRCLFCEPCKKHKHRLWAECRGLNVRLCCT